MVCWGFQKRQIMCLGILNEVFGIIECWFRYDNNLIALLSKTNHLSNLFFSCYLVTIILTSVFSVLKIIKVMTIVIRILQMASFSLLYPPRKRNRHVPARLTH